MGHWLFLKSTWDMGIPGPHDNLKIVVVVVVVELHSLTGDLPCN